MIRAVLIAIAGCVASAAIAAATPPQASIPFAATTGIDGWRAVDDDSLYIKSLRGQWYKADFFGPCIGLQFDPTLGFVVRYGSSFDRSSSVLVDGHECKVTSLVKVSGPPAEKRANEAKKAASERPLRAKTQQPNERRASTASIPFANLGGIRDWRATSDDTLYIQGRSGQWYRASLLGDCQGLRFEQSIGFVIEPSGSFDKFSSILVNGHECPLTSMTKSAGPPSRSASARE